MASKEGRGMVFKKKSPVPGQRKAPGEGARHKACTERERLCPGS